MNLPNLLTLSRVPVLFVIVGLIYLDLPGTATLAFFLFIFAGITDWLDGYLARRFNLVSNFGKLMDALTDKILIVGMYVALLAANLVPSWTIILVLLVVCREFAITGLRLVAASKGSVLAAEKSGKHKTLLQIISISVLLAVPVIRNDVIGWTGWDLQSFAGLVYWVGIGIFLAAVAITVSSAVNYLSKYWTLFFEVRDTGVK